VPVYTSSDVTAFGTGLSDVTISGGACPNGKPTRGTATVVQLERTTYRRQTGDTVFVPFSGSRSIFDRWNETVDLGVERESFGRRSYTSVLR
jgi:hypothetical protein